MSCYKPVSVNCGYRNYMGVYASEIYVYVIIIAQCQGFMAVNEPSPRFVMLP